MNEKRYRQELRAIKKPECCGIPPLPFVRYKPGTGKATLAVSQAALESYFSKQDRRSQVVVEATGNWMYPKGST